MNLIKILNDYAEEAYSLEGTLILNDIVENRMISKFINPSVVNDEVDELISNQFNLIQAYEEAPSFQTRRQILSLIPGKYSKSTIMKVFGISQKFQEPSFKRSFI